MLASPLTSVVALLWLTCRITGVAGLPEWVSSLPPLGGVPPRRWTVVRKATLAAITGFGGEAESVTRTTIG